MRTVRAASSHNPRLSLWVLDVVIGEVVSMRAEESEDHFLHERTPRQRSEKEEYQPISRRDMYRIGQAEYSLYSTSRSHHSHQPEQVVSALVSFCLYTAPEQQVSVGIYLVDALVRKVADPYQLLFQPHIHALLKATRDIDAKVITVG